MCGKSALDAKNGRPYLLCKEEEETVVQYTKYRAKAGHPVDKVTVLAMAAAVHARYKNGSATNFDVKKGPSNKWWLSFKKRHGVALRKPDPLDRGRRDAVDEEVISNFFDMYQSELTENGLQKAPHRIYNCDETGFT
ncbi:hypothetical protein Bbelb_289210 [Branchiostoma belcheri]|nr:hypothetical protein Bbelb_289210 [Branchiostoma belcheri]